MAGLTPVEREKVKDSRQKIESAVKTLKGISPDKVKDFEELEECLEQADQNLGEALQNPSK